MKKIISTNNKSIEAQKQKTVKTDRHELPGLLIQRTDERDKNKYTDEQLDRKNQIVELMNGRTIDLTAIQQIVKDAAGDYVPMFHTKKPFFKLMYELNGWTKLDPNNFIKPTCVSLWIKKYIYARFGADVLPSLLKKENPIIGGYIRKYKLFQFFDERGLIMLETVIDQMISVMKKSKNWYDFELKYTKKYKLPVQLKLFRD